MTMDPYRLLGVSLNDDKRAVHKAYLKAVKKCHPDKFTDPKLQEEAQEKLIAINLAYQKITKDMSERSGILTQLPLESVKQQAAALLDRGETEMALRLLARADSKDEGWYYLQGKLLMKLSQYDAAHQSFREAVRRAPDNQQFREAALKAALKVKRCQNPAVRLFDGIKQTTKRILKKK